MTEKIPEAIEKRALVQKLVERRYGPFAGAGGAGRRLFDASLGDQSIEVLRRLEESAAALELSRKIRRGYIADKNEEKFLKRAGLKP